MAPSTAAAEAAAGSAVAGILSRHGLRAVEPPIAAPDFTLPDLEGGRGSLSDHRGSWVVLTFWATWCGPCRAEMPSLERLHRSRGGEGGVRIVGVAVDDRVAPVERFVDEYGLTFLNLWDRRGEVGGLYRAQSIPLTFIVDPDGRLAGISRGARDWMELAPMVDALLELRPAGSRDGSHQVTGAAPGAAPEVELPATLSPPTAEVTLSDPEPRVGEPFALELRVRWAGDLEEYRLHPPRVGLPDGIEELGQSAISGSAEGSRVVTYRIELRAAAAGSYALDPVELVYTPRFEAQPLSTRLEGPTVVVSEPTLLGLSPAVLGTALAGLALAVLGGGLLLRRRRAAADSEGERRRLEALGARLTEARTLRLEGDLRGAALVLAETERRLGSAEESAGHSAGQSAGEGEEARRRWIQELRYGGRTPSPEELERLERRIERRLRELAPDPRAAERERLRLRSQEG